MPERCREWFRDADASGALSQNTSLADDPIGLGQLTQTTHHPCYQIGPVPKIEGVFWLFAAQLGGQALEAPSWVQTVLQL